MNQCQEFPGLLFELFPVEPGRLAGRMAHLMHPETGLRWFPVPGCMGSVKKINVPGHPFKIEHLLPDFAGNAGGVPKVLNPGIRVLSSTFDGPIAII